MRYRIQADSEIDAESAEHVFLLLANYFLALHMKEDFRRNRERTARECFLQKSTFEITPVRESVEEGQELPRS